MRRFHIILLSSAFGTSATAATPPWTISEASGGALVMHQGVIRPAHRNDRLVAGDTVMTGANARAVLVRGEEYAVVAPASRLQIADPAQTGGLVQMVERFGNVVFSIKKMATPHFGVQTPYLAAVVKGTTFSVTVGDGDAAVQVVEGAVEVATNDGRERDLVRPGGVAHVSSSDLGHLVVRGDTTPVSHGAARPAGGAAAHVERSATAVASLPHDADVAIPAMEEAPQSIAGLSGGLVAGDTAMRLAVAATGASAADRRVEVASGLIAPVAAATPVAPAAPVSAAPGSVDPTPPPPVATTPPATPPAAGAPIEPPATTAPPATTPPVTTPPVTTPPAATPPVTTPPVTTPVVTAPVTTPPVASPPVTTPVSTTPVVTPPATTPPVATPPVMTPPIVAPPVVAPPVTPPKTPSSGTGVTIGIGPGGVTVTPGAPGKGIWTDDSGSGISIGFGNGHHGGTDNGKGNGGMNNGRGNSGPGNGLSSGKFGR